MSDLEQTIQDVYRQVKKKPLNDETASMVLSALFSMRHLYERVLCDGHSLLSELFQSEPSHQVIYPCDLIELRPILKRQALTSEVLWSAKFASKFLCKMPVFLTLDLRNIAAPYSRCGGLILLSSKINVAGAISRVTVNHPVDPAAIDIAKQIVREVSPAVDFGVINHLESITVMAQSKGLPLNPTEENIFDLLRAFAATQGVTPRVAGGWVRDKLMGIESDDIDVAIDKMSGWEFANNLYQWAIANGMQEVDAPWEVSLEKDSQSKSSRTLNSEMKVGGIQLFGQKIELVPMRTEIYDETSRTPIAARTDNPEEDAVRRDLTINAMYYNVNTGQVEDHLGGRQDLQEQILRTPLPPSQTLTEDPLRALRIIRFATKPGDWKVHPDVMEAMHDPSVHKAYAQKVHPSRASKELRKIFSSDKVVDGARMLYATGIYKPVFGIPEDWNDITMDQSTPHHNLSLMEHTLEVMENYQRMTSDTDMPDNERMLMNLVTFSHDIAKMHPGIRKQKIDPETGQPATFGRGGEQLDHMQYIGHDPEGANFMASIMKQMGFDKSERDFVQAVVRHHMAPHHLEKNNSPSAIGRFLRDTDQLYDRVLEHAYADALSKGNMDPAKIEEINQSRQRQIEQVNQYRDELGSLVYQPAIDGNRVREIAMQVDPEMVSRNAMVQFGEGEKPVHFISYINNIMMERQWERKIQTPEQAEQLAEQMLKQFSAVWRQQKNMGARPGAEFSGQTIMELVPEIDPKTGYIPEVMQFVGQSGAQTLEEKQQKVLEWKKINLNRFQQDPNETKSMNWYKRIKTADASSGQGPEGYEGFTSYEGGPAIEEHNEITHYPLMHEQQRPEPMEYGVNDAAVEEVNGIAYMKRHPTGEKQHGPAFEKQVGSDETHYNPAVKVPYQKGDKVRRRGPGLAQPQLVGKVVDDGRNDQVVKIQWPGQRELEQIPLNQAAFLAHEIQKV